jgi:hypothetical protein
VRSVTSTSHECIETTDKCHNAPTQVDHSIDGLALLGGQLFKLKQLSFRQERR